MLVGERLDVGPVGVDIPQSILSTGQVAEQARGTRPSEAGHFLRFDDLIQRCARPEWKPDASYNLFPRADDNAKMGTERFRTLRSPGLTDYLRGEADEYAVIQHGPEANLCFLPSGRPVSNPSELLSSNRMKKLLDLVTPVFDWVILDSPPALPIHDANILADLCDGALFVVRAGETRYEIVEKGVLEFRGKNLLGVVLNQVDQNEGYGGYDGYPYDSAGKEE